MDFSRFTNIVNGQPRDSDKTCQGINPATEESLWPVPCASHRDVDDAVEAARAAFPSWSRTRFAERAHLLRTFADDLLAQEHGFTELLMRETGKPRDLANRELKSGCECVKGATTFTLPVETWEDETKSVQLTYVPAGVVGAICPWNYPVVLSLTKIVAALVTGNCCIVKPSPFTPYSTLKVVEVGQSSFPPGVLQVLGGGEDLGPSLVRHPGIQCISFTGSIVTGKKIMESAARTLKRVTLELGGNDAAIIRQDVNIEDTAPKVVMAAFKNSGQICVATKRVYVHEAIYDRFLEAMTDCTKNLKVGDPFLGDIDLGPIQNRMQYEKVQDLLHDCKANGHRFTTSGEMLSRDRGKGQKGYFVTPAILASPPAKSRAVIEEAFGPILPVMPYSSETDVIRAINDTNTGLGACIWSKDVEAAQRIASHLEVGSVYINSPLRPDWRVLFAGRKESGMGGERGLQGLLEFCEPLAIHTYK